MIFDPCERIGRAMPGERARHGFPSINAPTGSAALMGREDRLQPVQTEGGEKRRLAPPKEPSRSPGRSVADVCWAIARKNGEGP